MSDTSTDLVWLGDSAVTFPRPATVAPAVLSVWLREQPGVLDVVISDHRVALYFDPRRPPAQLEGILERSAQLQSAVAVGQTHRIAVRYDGPDLAAVAAATGLDVAQVIALHAQAEYQVGMLGFMPGFAYLQGLDSRLVLPRRDQPRARVPADSVAIGGAYSAIYPCTSPGGWNLLGTALEPLLLTGAGARLQLGDRVIFEPIP